MDRWVSPTGQSGWNKKENGQKTRVLAKDPPVKKKKKTQIDWEWDVPQSFPLFFLFSFGINLEVYQPRL